MAKLLLTDKNVSYVDSMMRSHQESKCDYILDALYSVRHTNIGDVAWTMLLQNGRQKNRRKHHNPIDKDTILAITDALKRISDAGFRDTVFDVWNNLTSEEMRILGDLRVKAENA